MKCEGEIRRSVKDWIARASGKVLPEEIDDATPLLERKILTSMQVMDLILFLETLLGHVVDVERLKAGAFRSVDAIYAGFFAESHVD